MFGSWWGFGCVSRNPCIRYIGSYFCGGGGCFGKDGRWYWDGGGWYLSGGGYGGIENGIVTGGEEIGELEK